MPSTTPIIAHVQQEFEALLTYVPGPETCTSTAYEVERALFRRLLALGLAPRRLFVLTRAAVRPPAPVGLTGPPVPYKDQRRVTYYSVFGKLTFARHAFTVAGQPVVCPLNAPLGLPERCYSDLLRAWMTYSSTDETFRESQTVLDRILGLAPSVQAIETAVTEAAVDVAAFYIQPPGADLPSSAGAIPVAQADGKGIPIVLPPPAQRPVRRGKGHPASRKREAVVTAPYTIAPYCLTSRSSAGR